MTLRPKVWTLMSYTAVFVATKVQVYTLVQCDKIVHVTCGISHEDDEGFGSQITCNHCVNEENIRINLQRRTIFNKNRN